MTAPTTAEMINDLRTKELSIEKRRAIADRLAGLDAEVKRLAGGESCEVCGSTNPAIRIIMPDNVGRRLFPDVPDVHEMACYWSNYHDPQDAVRVLDEAVTVLAPYDVKFVPR